MLVDSPRIPSSNLEGLSATVYQQYISDVRHARTSGSEHHSRIKIFWKISRFLSRPVKSIVVVSSEVLWDLGGWGGANLSKLLTQEVIMGSYDLRFYVTSTHKGYMWIIPHFLYINTEIEIACLHFLIVFWTRAGFFFQTAVVLSWNSLLPSFVLDQ